MKQWFMKLFHPSPRTARWLIFAALALVVGLSLLDYLEPLRAWLDAPEVTITLGEVRLSPYTVITGALVIGLLLWGARILIGMVEVYLRRTTLRASSRLLVTKLVQVMVYFVVFLVAMDAMGVDLTALTVFSGTIGIGLGFGLQKVTSNFISGLILLFEKSVVVDDLIELDNGISGFVRRIGARHTLLDTGEGKEIMIPNEDFITNRVTNWTFSNKKGRITVRIGVGYDSNLELAQKLMLEAAVTHPKCIAEPKPTCFLTEFGESAAFFTLHFWVEDVTDGRMAPQSDVMMAIWRAFRAHKIEIPFPQRVMHVRERVA